jgi:hypothetical protein
MNDQLISEIVSHNRKFAWARKQSSSIFEKARAYRRTVRRGFLLALAFFALASSALAQPTMSRGEQLLPISYNECIQRAEQAYLAEGWVNIGKGGAFVNAFKQNNGAYIMCNVAPENKIWVNIVVASNSGNAGVPGGERVCLQKQMDQPGNGCGQTKPPPVSTRTCTFQYTYWDGAHWTARIDRDQFTHAPNGDFSAAHSDNIIRYVSWDGGRWTAKISGNHFVHAPNDDWSRAHDYVILNYIDWNGAQRQVKIGDCGVIGIP